MKIRRGAGPRPARRAGTGRRAGPARFAVALAAAAIPLTLAAFLEHPEGAAETAYLGTLTALLLLAVAALPAAGRNFDPLVPAALLAVLALVALPPGPVRGTTVAALLALAAGAALTARLGGPAQRWEDELAALLPLAVAAQVLLRGDGLLAPAADLRTLIVYAALPVAAAAAAAFLALRHGRAAALTVGASAVLLGGGLHAVSTLALVAPAAGELLARPPARRRGAWRGLAALALVAPFAWQQRTAALALLAALAVAALPVDRRRAAGSWAAGALLTVLALLAAVLVPLQSWPATVPPLALGLLMLPLLPWSLLRDARRASPRLAAALPGLALAVAAARCAPDATALALPLAVLALTMAGRGAGRSGGVVLQGAWSAALTLVASLLAAYPWLRPDPARAALELLRIDPAGWSGLVLLVLATAFALTPAPAAEGLRRTGWLSLPSLTLVLLLVHALPEAPPPRTLVASPGVELDAESPSLELELHGGDAAPAAVRAFVARCHLSYATPVAAGTPVFDLLVFAGGDEPAVRWTFRAGRETAEWAARRPDVTAALGHRPPPHHLVWVAPGGDFFGQTYRARLELPRAVTPHRLVLRRRADLPPALTVHLVRLEGVP